MLKYILLILFGALIVFFIAPTLVLSYIIYSVVLVRTKPEKWSRDISMPDDEVQVRIYKDGENWARNCGVVPTEVSVINDRLRLAGQYFDFGSKNAVIIVPGRMEGCRYSYHFAAPYQQAGYNVLVIDNRAHGLSEGKRSSVGFREYRDVLAWAKLLHDTYHNEKIVLHGVCIGSSTTLFAAADRDCPDYVTATVADGMYATFYESFKNHMIEQKRALFPYLLEIMLHLRVFAGARPMTDGPIKRIGRLNKPILFLHSRTDIYSVPERAQALFDLCPSKKRIVWFDDCQHSRLRAKEPEKYDAAVTAFLRDLEQNAL